MARIEDKPQNGFCPNCLDIPSLKINEQSPHLIKINCVCGYNESIEIKDYLQYLTNKKNVIVQNTSIKCKKHQNLDYKFFCKKCKKNVCQLCVDKFCFDHSLVNLDNIYENDAILNVKNKMKEVTNYLNGYYYDLKEKYIKELQKQINNIEKAYQDSLNQVKNIISLLELLLEKTIKNYKFFENIVNNSNFQFSKFQYTLKPIEMYSDCVSLIKFYNENKIFKEKKIVDLSKLSEFQIINKYRQFDGEYLYSINHPILLKNKKLLFIDSKIIIYDLFKNEVSNSFSKSNSLNITDVAQLSDNSFLASTLCGMVENWYIHDNTFKVLSTIEICNERITRICALFNQKMAVFTRDKLLFIDISANYEIKMSVDLTGGNELLQLKNKKVLISGISGFKVFNTDNYTKETYINFERGDIQWMAEVSNRIIVELNHMTKNIYILDYQYSVLKVITFEREFTAISPCADLGDGTFLIVLEKNLQRLGKIPLSIYRIDANTLSLDYIRKANNYVGYRRFMKIDENTLIGINFYDEIIVWKY